MDNRLYGLVEAHLRHITFQDPALKILLRLYQNEFLQRVLDSSAMGGNRLEEKLDSRSERRALIQSSPKKVMFTLNSPRRICASGWKSANWVGKEWGGMRCLSTIVRMYRFKDLI